MRLSTATQIKHKKKNYTIKEAFDLMHNEFHTSFNETIDLSINVSNPKMDIAKKMILLPHSTGKKIRILFLTKHIAKYQYLCDKYNICAIGDRSTIDNIHKKRSICNYTHVLATPDIVPELKKIIRILTSRNIMLSHIDKTIPNNIEATAKKIQMNNIYIKVNKNGCVNISIGKKTCTLEQIYENITATIEGLLKLQPLHVKNKFIKSIYISTTMGPSFKLKH